MSPANTLALGRLPAAPFTPADSKRLGLSEFRLRALVTEGHVRRLLAGVYARSDLPDTIGLRAEAVAMVVAPHHVVVDRTAAWLLGIDTFAPHETTSPPPVETCALHGHAPTRRCDVRGRTRDLAPRDIMLVKGIRVTTPLRTALDLACNLRRREAFAALNAFARSHGVPATALAVEVDRYRRRRGVIQARELIPHVDARMESPRESWTLLAIIDAGLPPPEPQYWIEIDGVRAYRLDFAYPLQRVCVEYDGKAAHELTQAQREHDRARRSWLRRNGWTVIVIRRGDFSGDRLDRWLRRLREALATSAYTTRRW